MIHSYPGVRWCTGCKDYRPRAEFFVNSCASDGRLRECKSCIRARKATKREREAVRRPVDHGTWLKQQIGR